MINKAKIKIPYPKKVGFISLNFKRTVKFSFDMFALFLFHESEKINKMNDLAKWKESHGKFDLFVYGAYYAAKSFAIQNKKTFDLDLNKFALGLGQLAKEDLANLIEVWKRSQEYGSTDLPGKKKATAKP